MIFVFRRSAAFFALLGLVGCASPDTTKSRVGLNNIVIDEASGNAIALPDTLNRDSYAGEALVSDVLEQSTLKMPPLVQLTPSSHPNAAVLYTPEAYSTFRDGNAIFIYVNESNEPDGRVAAIPGSLWWPTAGLTAKNSGSLASDPIRQKLLDEIEVITGGDPTIRIVFYCDRPDCWTAYNAALRLSDTPYNNVAWYRGGTLAWYEAGLPLEVVETADWT